MLAEIIKIHHETPEASLVKYAAEQIKAGQVLGMPTDTFYGLAADPLNLRAVERVYEIKSRSRHKPLSLLIESVDQAEDLARPLAPGAAQRREMRRALGDEIGSGYGQRRRQRSPDGDLAKR